MAAEQTAASAIPTFYRRCRVCQREIEVELGPEAHSLSAYLLAEHMKHHSFTELLHYALASNGLVPNQVVEQPTSEAGS